MKELNKVWFAYLKKFPSDANNFATILNSIGLEQSIEMISRANERGQRIHIRASGGTDINVPFIV